MKKEFEKDNSCRIITGVIKYYTSRFCKDKTPLSFGHPP